MSSGDALYALYHPVVNISLLQEIECNKGNIAGLNCLLFLNYIIQYTILIYVNS